MSIYGRQAITRKQSLNLARGRQKRPPGAETSSLTFFFEAVVTVNLTCLLVLVTMFISISTSLPKTSYIKMVDYWLIFTLLLPFVEVLLHTYIESLNEDEERTINHHGVAMEIDENGEKREKGIAQVSNINLYLLSMIIIIRMLQRWLQQHLRTLSTEEILFPRKRMSRSML